MDNNTRLSYYRKSLQSAWGYNDYNDWPVKLNSVMHIFLVDFATEFLEDLNELEEKKVSIEEISKAFGNPSRFYRLIDPVIFGMKRLKMNLQEQREVVIHLLDIVKKMKYGSEFNENGVNAILSPGQVSQLLERLDMKKADKHAASMIQRFCGIAWAYTESILFRAHEVTKEVHGPYNPDNSKEKLLIREYLHLSPAEIWGDMPFVPYKKFEIFTKYLNSIDVAIDSYNHLFLNKGNYVADMTEYAIEADGQAVGIDKLMEAIPYMQKTIQAVNDWADRADWHEKVNRYADIYWYRKSPLRNLLGKDWRVPETVREKIKNGDANPKRLTKLSDESIERLIRIVI